MILFLLVSVIPSEYLITDNVKMVELNHLYDGNGRLILDQVVWWDWDRQTDSYVVRDWRLIRNCRHEEKEAKEQWNRDFGDKPPYVPRFIGGHATPRKQGDSWVSDWMDEKCNRRRVVKADIYRETWSIGDPELLNREILPSNQRKLLTKPRVMKKR